jgi:vitamin B12 transporter
MSMSWRRFAACLARRVHPVRLVALTVVVTGIFALLPSARAVVVRGRLTDPLGQPVAGGKVQLVQDGKVAGIAFAGPDGDFEIRSSNTGRFRLLGFGAGYLSAVGTDFYGGTNDVLEMDVVLSAKTIRQEVSVTATGFPTPLPQLTAPVTLVDEAQLTTRVGVIDEMRQAPGVFLEETGQYGGVTSLFVRGGPSDGNKVLVDGVPAEDVGGSFDWGTVSSTGLSSIETYRGPNSALYGTDSQAAVVSLTTPRGTTQFPLLTYSGDAGTLHSYRNEAAVSGAISRFDYLAGVSRFETSNALPNDEYHSTTAAANLGAHLFEGADARLTLRSADSSEGLPGPVDFYGLTQQAKEGDQDLYSGLTLEDRLKDGWHNLFRYGIARKREQETPFGQQGTYDPTQFGYFGNVVTIRGANGYTTTDKAAIYAGNPYNQDSNRDELYYQSDYVFPHRVAVLFGFRYENERGSFNYDDVSSPAYSEYEVVRRTNFEYNLQVQGDVKGRFFYSLGGSVQKNHLYGIAGEPRIGLGYVPVRPGVGWFHGTKVRLNAATGVQEPSLADQFESLYLELLPTYAADIAALHIPQLGPERSRTFDVGVDQNVLGQTLVLKAGYFHNQFSHQLEYVDGGDIQTYFPGLFPANDPNFYGAVLNSEAYRAEGAEAELDWQPRSHWFVRGGYTYLDTVVEQSFASDVTAVLQGYPNTNPKYPTIAIGNSSPLIGARPFRRPPHTGFFAVNYAGKKLNVGLTSSMASRADDSTFLGGDSPNYGNTLLLPNRDLDYGYVKLDLGATYQFKPRFGVFVQLDNLLNDQHIGPIGYPGLPFTARAGMKVRLGGD